MNRRSRTAAGVAVGVVALVVTGLLVLNACSGDPEPDDTTDPDDTSTTSQEGGVDPEQLSTDLLAQGESLLEAEPVAQGEGTVQTSRTETAPARADILSVERTPGGTMLAWTLTSLDGDVRVVPSTFLERSSGNSADDVALVDSTAALRLKPYGYTPSSEEGDEGLLRCFCSSTPDSIDGEGAFMYGLYPDLGEGLTEVDVVIPGFEPITGVPVTEQG